MSNTPEHGATLPQAVNRSKKRIPSQLIILILVVGCSTASLYAMRPLVKQGVKILRWRGVMMHAKTAVVDERWSTIGSYNFDAMSRFNNLEVTVEILDHAVGTALVKNFQASASHCDPYTNEAWMKLPWYTKALAWLCFRLRRFL